MAKQTVLRGATSRTEYIFVQDSSSTTGAGLTGLVWNAGSLAAYYVRPLGSATQITLATQTVTGAWSSGGFVEVSSANMPGVYRFDVPDAVFATGVDKAVVILKGATNMAPVLLEYQLALLDPNDGVRAGLTALPNAVAGANGGLPLGNASGRVDVGNWLGSAPDALSSGKLPADVKLWLASAPSGLNSGLVQADVERWLNVVPNALATGRVDASVGAYPGNTAQTGDNYARLGAPAGASVSADIALLQADTDNLQTRIPAALVGGRIDANVGAYPGNTAQTGDNYVRLGAPVHASISADIAAISGGSTTVYGVTGSILYTYTVYKPDLVSPLPGAAVYVSANIDGTNRSSTLVTDDLGKVQFHLDPATVYFWRSHPQYTFTNPDTEVVS